MADEWGDDDIVVSLSNIFVIYCRLYPKNFTVLFNLYSQMSNGRQLLRQQEVTTMIIGMMTQLRLWQCLVTMRLCLMLFGTMNQHQHQISHQPNPKLNQNPMIWMMTMIWVDHRRRNAHG